MHDLNDQKVITKQSAQEQDLIIISDLHLAAGKRKDGCFSGTENFFSDAAFCRWLQTMSQTQASKTAILIINGDFVDFLRVTETPQTDTDFLAWSYLLDDLGFSKSVQELKRSIIPKERKFGLRTDDYKSVWKLRLVMDGHAELFNALGEWLNRGNQLWITKGNHDLEWHWKLVQRCLHRELSLRMSTSITEEQLGQQVCFFEDCLLIDEQIYIEHGHRYDPYSHVEGDSVLDDTPTELNIPFGSFLNRYLLNRIELDYPFLDNIRPSVNILPILIRERFPLALKFLAWHIPFVILIIPKHYYAYVFQRLLVFLLAVGGPIIVFFWTFIGHLLQGVSAWPMAIQNIVWLVVSYFAGRLVAIFQLAQPDSLVPSAETVFRDNPTLQLVMFGHTHIAAQTRQTNLLYLNTGTWIPVIENSIAAIRSDHMFTFLRIPRHKPTNWDTLALDHWNDDAQRAEPMILINKR